MNKKKKKGRKTKRKIRIKKLKIISCLCLILVIAIVVITGGSKNTTKLTKAMNTVDEFMSYINEKDYGSMYELLSINSKANITKQDFIDKNEDIYGKLEASHIVLSNMSEENEESTRKNKSYLYKSNGDTCRNINIC